MAFLTRNAPNRRKRATESDHYRHAQRLQSSTDCSPLCTTSQNDCSSTRGGTVHVDATATDVRVAAARSTDSMMSRAW